MWHVTVLILLMFSLQFPLSADNSLGKKLKAEGKKKIEQIIKFATGVAPTMMARGNYGRLLLQRKVGEKMADAMPTPEKKTSL